MENIDKGLTVPKWVRILWPKIPHMQQNLSAKFVCSSPKVLDFNEKRLHWVSVVRGSLAAENDDYLEYWGQNRFSNRIRKKRFMTRLECFLIPKSAAGDCRKPYGRNPKIVSKNYETFFHSKAWAV